MINVLLVTTWGAACGISEHASMLKEAVERADPEIQITPCPEALDPFTRLRLDWTPDVLHLNYQASLHSRWTPLAIRAWREEKQIPIVVTFHDTGVPNSGQCKQVIVACDAAVVHEPFDDLPEEKTRYWRMGVPAWQPPYQYDRRDDRPILGSLGFPFPWKCYDQLAQVTAANGWGLVLLAPGATPEQIAAWQQMNPHTTVEPYFLPRSLAISQLAGCDATAFTYVTHNTGQSGAILQGIAAHKPVLALNTCRQFRALHEDPLGREAIRWATTFEEVGVFLRRLPIQRLDPGIVALAEQDSWTRLGRRYADVYREVMR